MVEVSVMRYSAECHGRAFYLRTFLRLIPGLSMKRSHSLVVLLAAMAIASTPLLAQSHTYKVLATSKTSTMQKEMQEAGDAGFHFVAVMGGETAMGGKE